MPRVYFTVPPCHFCVLDSRNEPSHIEGCSHLYVRAGVVLRRVITEFRAQEGGSFHAQRNLQTYVLVGDCACWLLLVPRSRVTHFQQLRERGDNAQVLDLTWSGLS